MPTAIACARPGVTDTACTDAATKMITVPVKRVEPKQRRPRQTCTARRQKPARPAGRQNHQQRNPAGQVAKCRCRVRDRNTTLRPIRECGGQARRSTKPEQRVHAPQNPGQQHQPGRTQISYQETTRVNTPCPPCSPPPGLWRCSAEASPLSIATYFTTRTACGRPS